MTWIILVAYWLRRLDKGLELFPPLFIIPVLQVFFVFFAIMCGGVYFEEFIGFTYQQYIGFVIGVVMILGRIFHPHSIHIISVSDQYTLYHHALLIDTNTPLRQRQQQQHLYTPYHHILPTHRIAELHYPTLSTHLINPSYYPTLSTHLIIPPYQATLSTHLIKPPYQHTLSTHLINPPYQPTLSTHLINPPYKPTL